MKIRRVDPQSQRDLHALDLLERNAFELMGNDPTELTAVLQFIASQSVIYLGYETAQPGEKIPEDLVEVVGADTAKGGEEIPVAFGELISYNRAQRLYMEHGKDDSFEGSPLIVSMADASRICRMALGYTKEARIVLHHGMGGYTVIINIRDGAPNYLNT